MAPDRPKLGDNCVKWSKLIPEDQNDWFWENSEKFSKKTSDFGGGDGTSNRFFERASTFINFWWLDPDRTGQGLQFALYGDLEVAWAQKILRNYEKFITKS